MLAFVAVVLGCNAIAGIDELYPNATSVTAASSSAMGSGGAGGATVAASSSSSSGGMGGEGGGGGAPPTGCTAQYGHVPFFILCTENALQCSFYAHVEPQTCAQLCASGGGECLGGYNNLNDMVGCMQKNPVTCADSTLMDAICVCSFGCGMGPPCMGVQKCKDGMCM